MRVWIVCLSTLLFLHVGFAQESCMTYLFTPCDGDPQQYECVQVTTVLSSTNGGESTTVNQEMCFYHPDDGAGSPLFGGMDDPSLGVTVDTNLGDLKVEDLAEDVEIGEFRFDVEVAPGVTAYLRAPITVTEILEDFIAIESRVIEANDIIKDEVLTYDPMNDEHNGGLMLEGTLKEKPEGGFTMFLHLAELKVVELPTAAYPGLEYSDLSGVGSPVPLFFEPLTKEGFYLLPAEGGVLTVRTELSALNEASLVVEAMFEETFDITSAAPQFRRGDTNRDGGVNIADAIYILQNLFASGPDILCQDAADANDDESVNIADGIYILQNLFASGPDILPPSPECGIDTTPHPQGLDDLPPCDYCPEACEDPPVPCAEPQ